MNSHLICLRRQFMSLFHMTFLSEAETRSGLCGCRATLGAGSGNRHGRCTRTRCVYAAFSPQSSGKCPCSRPRWRLGGWNPFLSGGMSLAGDVSVWVWFTGLGQETSAAHDQLCHTVESDELFYHCRTTFFFFFNEMTLMPKRHLT